MTDNNGWVKLHRKMLDNPIVMKDSDHLAVWIYLLLNASHTEYQVVFNGKKMMIHPGQLITGRRKISDATGVQSDKVYRIIKLLKSEQQITQQTSNKNSLISIINWEEYQNVAQQDTQQMHNRYTTDAQQMHNRCTTSAHKQEYKEYKECKEVIYSEVPELNSAIISFIDYRKEIHKPMSRKEVNEMIGKLGDMTSSDDEKIRILNQSMKKGWVGIFPLKEKKKNQFMTAESHQYNFEELERILLANSEGGNNND